MARFDAVAVTVFALIVQCQIDLLFNAKYRFFERQRHARFDVVTTSWTLTAARIATKKLTKDVAESAIAKVEVYILPTKSAKSFERIARKTSATTSTAADASVTKLVVALPFLLVFEDFVGFVRLFEFFLIATLFVRMILDRQLAKRLFDLVLGGRLGNP